ncbi:hypothetical protein RYH80_11135 [Halobaculum sp. MBLA0147]|uniref:hypothetical protein n=1 Tax=Halobaculum sp. MBLA0147 TaxID=3079934 RepID=UPI00352688F4
MTYRGIRERIGSSQVAAKLASRPRLLTLLVLSVALLAVQGTVAAEADCATCVTTSGDDDVKIGP